MQTLFYICVEYIKRYPSVFLVVFVCTLGGLFAVFFCLLVQIFKNLLRSWQEKRKKTIEQRRSVRLALPEKDNIFVRERLRFVLNAKDEELTEEETPKARTYFQFLYAQKLLNQLTEKQLTTAERLELMEMNAFLSASLGQTQWTETDLRAVNDCFSRLLKLCAKHAVELPA